MRKIILVLALSLALFMGFTGSAVARSERACVGTFVSGLATELGRDFGQTVSQEAKDFHPFGQTIVSGLATTCEFPE